MHRLGYSTETARAPMTSSEHGREWRLSNEDKMVCVKSRKRWGLMGFVVSALLLAGFVSLSPATWATPIQGPDHGAVTVPPIKTVDNDLLPIGGEAVFEVLLANPQEGAYTWSDVVITDTIDSRLSISGLTTSQGSFGVDGQEVTVDVGDILPGEQATIKIYVALQHGDAGDIIENRAYAARPGDDPLGSTEARITIPYPYYLPLTMKRYAGP